MSEHILDDLANLPLLSEDLITESIRDRFRKSRIYTMTGPVLLSLNPFHDIAELYSKGVIAQYRLSTYRHQPPHIFQIAQAAYDGMEESRKQGRLGHQSILISGESGSGKTEAIKFIMSFLCHFDGSVEKQILESNPLLEAFGNAATSRNHNSSRFGKFTQLNFCPHSSSGGSLVVTHARIETYLLEKIRVTTPMERNFHIFYQCCAAAAAAAANDNSNLYQVKGYIKIRLEGFRADHTEFEYLSAKPLVMSSSVDDDLNNFDKTMNAMLVIGMSVVEIEEILNLVASVLHIGNIHFVQSPCGEYVEGVSRNDQMSEQSFYLTCALLGLEDSDTLETALISRSLTTADVNIRLSQTKAIDSRDTLARFIYSIVFNYLVYRINTAIDNRAADSIGDVFCGLLDIFGFESLFVTQNRFEQLCINYANERLQNLFVNNCLKSEQCLYQSEGLEWNRVDFPDNSLIISLLDGGVGGFFPMLDEECRIVGGNDMNLLSKLNKASSTTAAATRNIYQPVKTRNNCFIIKHFAGNVTYTIDGFVDNNKDTLSPDLALIATHHSPILRKIFLTTTANSSSSSSSSMVTTGIRRLSVSGEFRDQLNRLMTIIHSTNPFFVRCIKPNKHNLPMTFEDEFVIEQLRYGGIIQAVEISRSGYPVRIEIFEFIRMFGPLVGVRGPASSAAAVSKDIFEKLDSMLKFPRIGSRNLCYAVGKTRVFMKKEVWEVLSRVRNDLLNQAAIRIQSFAKGWIARLEYKCSKAALVGVQSHIRTAMIVREKIRNDAACRIQSAYHTIVIRKSYKQTLGCIIRIQKFFKRRYKLRFSSRRKRTSAEAGGKENEIFRQLEELGAELRAAKDCMSSAAGRVAEIPPAPFSQKIRFPPASPIVDVPGGAISRSTTMGGKIGSMERRILKVNDDMEKMRQLIDRIQSNMNDI